MYLSDDRTTHRAEAPKAIFQHRTLILRYGAVQQTAQIAAARDLALFVILRASLIILGEQKGRHHSSDQGEDRT
jgi:hypothetical protein